jgi:hypothetical protein
MSIRTLGFLAACLAPAAATGSELVLLQGQLTGGSIVISTGDGPYELLEGFPVPYTGIFAYDPVTASAAFQFTPLIAGSPPTHLIRDNLFPGVLQNDAQKLLVDYDPPLAAFMQFFELDLDKTNGQGHWQWNESCAVCDRIFDPSAQATITSFREVRGGDFNEDGEVDATDLGRWLSGFDGAASATHANGDANADLNVDGADFLIWQRQLGAGPPAIAAAHPVPEPAAAWLMICLPAAWMLRGRRRG